MVRQILEVQHSGYRQNAQFDEDYNKVEQLEEVLDTISAAKDSFVKMFIFSGKGVTTGNVTGISLVTDNVDAPTLIINFDEKAPSAITATVFKKRLNDAISKLRAYFKKTTKDARGFFLIRSGVKGAKNADGTTKWSKVGQCRFLYDDQYNILMLARNADVAKMTKYLNDNNEYAVKAAETSKTTTLPVA